MYTTEQFAERIKKQYPQYAELDAATLTKKIVEKYPVYKEQITDFGMVSPTVPGIQTNLVSTEPEPPLEESKGAFGSFGGAVKSFFSGVGDAMSERSANKTEIEQKREDGTIGAARGFLRHAGEGAGFVGDIGFEGLKFLAPQFVERLAGDAAQSVGETEVAQAAVKKYDELKQKHPEAMADVEAVFNIASLVPIAKGAQITGRVAKETAEATASGAATTARVAQESAESVARKADEALTARRAARLEKMQEEVDMAVGQIIQGTPDDIAKAKRALQNIDTKGVETYEDLNIIIDDKVKTLSRTIDEMLDAQSEPIKDFARRRTVGEGENAFSVTSTPVQNALDELDNFYKKINDDVGAAEMSRLKQKLETSGLTLREVNDLARRHGRDLNAFNANGELASGLSKQAAENTRKGLKDVVRERLPDDATKELDSQISDLLQTQRLTEKIETKVQQLEQRLTNRTLAQKFGGTIASVVDLATFGSLRGFIARLMPSNIGNKAMNYKEIEEALQKNLKKLQQIIDADDEKAVRLFQDYVRDVQPGLSTRDITRSIPEEDINFMDDFAEKLKNETASAREIEIMDELAERYGFQLPTSNKKKADVIGQIATSLKERSFNEATDATLQRR